MPIRSLPLVVAFVLLVPACSGGGTEMSTPAPPAGSRTPAPSPAPPPPLLGNGTYVAATVHRSIIVFREPEAATAEFVLDTRNPFGQRTPLLVVGAERDPEGRPWYEVSLPIRPNGSTGWMRGYELRIQETDDRIVVDLSDRTLALYRQGRRVDEFSVAIGAAGAPTAVGSFFVWARVPQPDPSGPYGIFALGLSGFSETLTDWEGSNGRIAIHGTSDPGDRGQRVSHGCIRVYNPDMVALTHLPLGTPVIVRR